MRLKVNEIALYIGKFEVELRSLSRKRQIRIDSAIKDYMLSIKKGLVSC